MNEFTKEELEKLLSIFTSYYCDPINPLDFDDMGLIEKTQLMIDNHQVEKEIYCCHSGLAVSDDFFCQQQSMDAEDLLPVFHELIDKCDGMITKSGIYAFKLRLVKLK